QFHLFLSLCSEDSISSPLPSALLAVLEFTVLEAVDYPSRRSFFFFSSRRRHTRSVSAFLLNRSSDLFLPVWFALSLLRFRLPSRLPMMFILWMVAMMVVIIPSRTV